MRKFEYCDCIDRKDVYNPGPMIRIYIRSSEGKEIRDRKYLDWNGTKIRKQIFKPIGWLCGYCKKLRYDKGFWQEDTD